MCLSSDGGTENATSKPQLKDLMEALYNNVADKWKIIGVLIEIPKGTLAGIAEKWQHDPHKCLVDMLEIWLEQIHQNNSTLSRMLQTCDCNFDMMHIIISCAYHQMEGQKMQPASHS